MNETIEKMIIKILNEVSVYEKSHNKLLCLRTAKVLKALEYMKATVQLNNNVTKKMGV